jgi:hypothetical protein
MSGITTTETQTQDCLRCGYTTDRASDVLGRAQPAPGDLTICLKCGNVMKFGSGLSFEALSADEWEGLPTDVKGTCYRIQRARREATR